VVDYLGVFTATCQVATAEQFRGAHVLASGYRPNLVIGSEYSPCQIEVLGIPLSPGGSGEITIRAILSEQSARNLQTGFTFELRKAAHTVAWCTVHTVELLEAVQQP